MNHFAELMGRRVVIQTDADAYIGGAYGGRSSDGGFFLLADEICLDLQWGPSSSQWEDFKHEPRKVYGQIVDDPRVTTGSPASPEGR